jgi:site-specific DNA-methyltransferase (adenine-specific)
MVAAALARDGVAVLPPMDAHAALALVRHAGAGPRALMLDPWYNRGVGGVRDDHDELMVALLRAAAVGRYDHVYLWGFPEIVARIVTRIPEGLGLLAWLTWFYKNSPSVIRGWRSSQMACLHLTAPGVAPHPEHFLTPEQLERLTQKRMRFVPGPTSVIEEPLLVGFVGRAEQTGHPAQKPVAVFRRLILMATLPGEVVVDPMCGSGTTGAAAREVGRRAILADHSEEYTRLTEERLGVARVRLPEGYSPPMAEPRDTLTPATADRLRALERSGLRVTLEGGAECRCTIRAGDGRGLGSAGGATPEDAARAALEMVDVASIESFPASDPPQRGAPGI